MSAKPQRNGIDSLYAGQVRIRHAGRHQGAEVELIERLETSVGPAWLVRSLTARVSTVREMYEDDLLAEYDPMP